MEPQITVLMPTYNGEKYLKDSIASILNQTFKDFELLIINDGSPEKTDKIIESFHDERIRYIKNQTNIGISQSSNLGLSLARGRYIARQDHDDIALPTRLEEQFNYMEAHPEIGVCGTGYQIFGKKNRKVIHPTEDKAIKARLLFKCTMAHQTTLIRKEVLEKYGLKYDTEFQSSNDRKLWIDLCNYTKFHNLPQILLKYRMHRGMTSQTKRAIVLEEARKMRRILYNRMNIKLSGDLQEVADTYLFQGRARVKDLTTLKKIEQILLTFIEANNKTNVFDKEEFAQTCGEYFHKKCINGGFFGHINTKKTYNNSPLRHYNQYISWQRRYILSILNFLFRP